MSIVHYSHHHPPHISLSDPISSSSLCLCFVLFGPTRTKHVSIDFQLSIRACWAQEWVDNYPHSESITRMEGQHGGPQLLFIVHCGQGPVQAAVYRLLCTGCSEKFTGAIYWCYWYLWAIICWCVVISCSLWCGVVLYYLLSFITDLKKCSKKWSILS